jgi:hypothetical protein
MMSMHAPATMPTTPPELIGPIPTPPAHNRHVAMMTQCTIWQSACDKNRRAIPSGYRNDTNERKGIALDSPARMHVEIAGLSRFKHDSRGQSWSQLNPSPLWHGSAAHEQLNASAVLTVASPAQSHYVGWQWAMLLGSITPCEKNAAAAT